MNTKKTFLTITTLLFCTFISAKNDPSEEPGQWPAYRHDMLRSGITREKIQVPLHTQWIYESPHAPSPAWPEPGREVNRVAFDYAYQVTSAGGLLYFGSSSDHKIYALDLETGRERWSFFTGGPVRFAPVISGNRIFAASDDGWLYCLSAREGKLIWKFFGGSRQEKIIGNGQMISRWPLRSSVGIVGNIVYTVSGMWPNETVYVYALNAQNGQVIWKNDTSGSGYKKQPHPGSFSMSNVAPQGYVLCNQDQLFVPTGRNVPACYKRATGKLLYYRSAPTVWANRWGGSWNFLYGGMLFGWTSHIGPDIDIHMGEYTPDPNDGIIVFDAKSSIEKREFHGKLRAVVRDDIFYATGMGKIGAYNLKDWLAGNSIKKCARWESPIKRTYSLIMAGDTLIAGGRGTVTAVSAASGKILWKGKVRGNARGLAVAGGRLLVSTTEGEITCFGAEAVKNPPTINHRPVPAFANDSKHAETARRIIKETGKKRGYCLVTGAGNGGLLYQLAKQTDLKILCVEPDPGKVAAVRNLLDAAGLYGLRVTVHQGSLEKITYPDYFADLIISDGNPPRDSKQVKNLYRLLHPYGGVAYFKDGPSMITRGKLKGAGSWTHQYANPARTGCSDDERVKLPLKLLWFGKPGPARMITRHWAGPAPLCINGRMFVIQQKSITAVDSFNGLLLWRRDFPKVGRFPIHSRDNNVAADKENIYFATGRSCLRMDGATGKTIQTYKLPALPKGLPEATYKALKWSYLAVINDSIIGSIGNERESRCVFVLDKKRGQTKWTYTTSQVLSCHAIVANDDRIYLIDKIPAGIIANAQRRGKNIDQKSKLVAIDIHNGNILWQKSRDLKNRTNLWLSAGILVATGGNGMTAYEASTGKYLYKRDLYMERFPLFVGDTIYAAPLAYDIRTGKTKSRTIPFNGAETTWTVHKGYGCGSMSAAPNVLLFRSSTLGIYDLAADSGIHNFGGIRAGCYVNAIAADGLVLMPPADAACTCSYNHRTTIALEPVKGPEDWSIFYDMLPKAPVQQAALNLGAPGDMRDSNGTLWLSTPRPGTRNQRPDFSAPFRFHFKKGFGPYKVMLQDVNITGTNRPWIYTNGLKGPLKAELDLDIFDRGFTCWPVTHAPLIDGKLNDPCWDGYKSISIPGSNGSVTLRYDDKNLYAAYKRPALVNDNDSFELYLARYPRYRSFPSTEYIHLGVSPSGKRFDSHWKYVTPFPVCDIPKIDATIDGKADDWKNQGLMVNSLTNSNGRLRPPDDFDPTFRFGWNDAGLLILADVKDNEITVSSNPSKLSNGDSLDLFLSPVLGATEGYEVTLAPRNVQGYSRPAILFTDRRKKTRINDLKAKAAGRKTPNGYIIELLLPWNNLNIKPATGHKFAMQLFANDGGKGNRHHFQVRWHPGGNPVTNKNPFAFQEFRLAEKPGRTIEFKRSSKPGAKGLFTAVRPLPFPNSIPPMGMKAEDTGYTDEWSSGVSLTKEYFTAEIAIPWKTLSNFSRSWMIISLSKKGLLQQPPLMGQEFERLILVPSEKTRPRSLSLRLHFAELEDVNPGERVFDVKVNGKTVLKDFDVVAAAGGRNRAIVKDIKKIVTAKAVKLELIPKVKKVTDSTAPIISGIEILPSRK